MPLVKLQTSVEVDADKKNEILAGMSKIVSDVTGKPETYIMVTMQKVDVVMAGSAEPAAFADIRGIGGLDAATNTTLSSGICELLTEKLGIVGDRVYLNFTDISASNWGWNSSTFG